MDKIIKFNCNENPDIHVTGIPIFIGTNVEMERVVCPHCHGNFAVDREYLDQVDGIVHCPMCCLEVYIYEPDYP
jgi:predicted Zn finger-like uncharacterized protein